MRRDKRHKGTGAQLRQNTQRPVMTDKVRIPAEITPATISSIMIPMPPVHCDQTSGSATASTYPEYGNHKPGGNPLPVIGRQRHERDHIPINSSQTMLP